MTDAKLNEATALELARRLEAGELTAERIVQASLERIAAREPTVRAWTHLERDGALAAARRLDAGPRAGLLHGIPIGIKDIIDTADMPTGYGSPIYARHQPPSDAATVAIFSSAGRKAKCGTGLGPHSSSVSPKRFQKYSSERPEPRNKAAALTADLSPPRGPPRPKDAASAVSTRH